MVNQEEVVKSMVLTESFDPLFKQTNYCSEKIIKNLLTNIRVTRERRNNPGTDLKIHLHFVCSLTHSERLGVEAVDRSSDEGCE